MKKQDWTTCECGKRGFLKKSEAHRARRGHRGRTHMGIYRCDSAVGGYHWHLGHKPGALIRGEIDRTEIRTRPPSQHTYLEDASADHELADRYEREGDHQ